MPEIDLASALETNVLKLGTMTMEAHADRLIIVQDEFRSGYECTTCRAKDIRMISQTEQRSVVVCEDCLGLGKRVVAGAVGDQLSKKCSTCNGQGWHVCSNCNGSGVAGGGIAHAQDSERRPTTGTIASVGDQIWCPACQGNGSIAKAVTGIKGTVFDNCARCKGTGGTKQFERGQSVIYPSFAGHAYDLVAEGMYREPVEITIVILRESEVLAKISGHLELRRVKKSAAMGTAA